MPFCKRVHRVSIHAPSIVAPIGRPYHFFTHSQSAPRLNAGLGRFATETNNHKITYQPEYTARKCRNMVNKLLESPLVWPRESVPVAAFRSITNSINSLPVSTMIGLGGDKIVPGR